MFLVFVHILFLVFSQVRYFGYPLIYFLKKKMLTKVAFFTQKTVWEKIAHKRVTENISRGVIMPRCDFTITTAAITLILSTSLPIMVVISWYHWSLNYLKDVNFTMRF